MDLELWVVSGNIWPSKEYQKGLQTLLYHQEENVLTQIPHWPGIGGLANVLNKTQIQFEVILTGSWTFLPFSYHMNIG